MHFLRAFFVVACFSSALAAQTGSQTPPASQDQKPAAGATGSESTSTQPTPQQQNPATEKELEKQEQSQRVFGVMPQFAVTNRQNAPPLTRGQKFHLFARTSFDPFQYFAAGFQAGLGQATNEFPAYGQGAAGYGKRYGAALADQVSSSFFGIFVYPLLLKEDPRYFRLGKGSIKHRVLYSLEQAFVCHTDKGGRSFNWSNVLGAFTSGAISNAYYPSADRGVGLTASRSAIALLYGATSGLLDEFWIDIHNKFSHKHSDKH